MTKAIYLKNEEEWIGIDQKIEDINFQLYDELKTFLYGYFCQNSLDQEEEEEEEEEEKKWNTQLGSGTNRAST